MNRKDEFYTIRGYRIKNSEKRLLTPSMEDYLEMIYRICKDDDYIRINQLASKLNVRPSSATKIVQRLKNAGMIQYEKYGTIHLTDKGIQVGGFLLKRHNVLEEFLKNIGVEDTRLRDTEMIEHNISINALKGIYILNEFLFNNPDISKELENYRLNYCKEANLFDFLEY